MSDRPLYDVDPSIVQELGEQGLIWRVEPDYKAARRVVESVAAFVRTKAVIHADDYEAAMSALTQQVVDVAFGGNDE